jgi:hypothetical protein
MIHLAVVTMIALAQTQAEHRYTPGTERRVFEVRSKDAWPVVEARLKELGLAMDKVDRKNQALLTKWRHFSGGDWIPDPQMPAPFIADQIRFVVFVSPFVEPAHISVGSQMDVTQGNTRGTLFNVASANQAVMAELDKALAAASLPHFVRDDSARCRPNGTATITEGKKIPLSVFEVFHPGGEKEAGKAGNVVFDVTVGPDGGVAELSPKQAPAGGEQLAAAALGAVSLLLYSPTLIGGCGVDREVVTYTVQFQH